MDDKDGVSVHMGFPNPAADKRLEGLDLHKLLVKNPSSTFFMRIEGNEWEERGIFDGDIVVIDRALKPRKTDLLVVGKDDLLLITPAGKLPKDSTLWGVVTSVVHRYRDDKRKGMNAS
jgi:DNA polymerase V